jgi:hypothetical protein
MRPDLYTKAVLTVIAIMLTVLVLKPFSNPPTTAQAQGSFSGVMFAASGAYEFFDPRTGELWVYGAPDGTLVSKFRVTRFGQPLTKEK